MTTAKYWDWVAANSLRSGQPELIVKNMDRCQFQSLQPSTNKKP